MINISFIVNEHYANDLLKSVHSKRSGNLSEMVKYMKIYPNYFFLEISPSHYRTLSKVGSKSLFLRHMLSGGLRESPAHDT